MSTGSRLRCVASFNASYDHEQERALWTELYCHLRENDLHVFEFQCRAVPENELATQYIFPASLVEFGKKIELGEYISPCWFDETELNFSIEWELKRWRPKNQTESKLAKAQFD